MPRALISTIGSGNGVDDGIIFSIQKNNPDLLLMIYSEQSKHTFKKVKESPKLSKELRIMDEQIDEVDDLEILVSEYGKCIRMVIEEGYTPEQIVVDYTSGTKSMSSALVYISIINGIGTLSYISGRRSTENGGRVMSGTERLYSLSPTQLYTSQRLSLFRELFNKFRFEAAIQLLEAAIIHPDFKILADSYFLLAKGYDAWDRFEFEEASNFLNKIDLKLENLRPYEKMIRDHKQILYKLKSSSAMREDDADDLYYNAKRRFTEGRFDDSVSRLYRLLELYGQIEFSNHYSYATDKVPFSELPQELKEKFKFANETETVKLALVDTFLALKDKNGDRIKTFHENFKEIEKLLSIRNNSRLAHGRIPVNRRQSEKMFELVEKIFKPGKKIEFPQL
jgi:CRISPR-associated protein (TIGR02710 family)